MLILSLHHCDFLGFVFQKWFAFIRCAYTIELSLKTYGSEKLRFTAKISLNTYAISYTGSGRVFSGYGIWPKCTPGLGKKQNILTGFGISLLSGKRDLLKFGHGTRELFSLCREIGKLLRPKNTLRGEKLKQINQVSAAWCLLSNSNNKNNNQLIMMCLVNFVYRSKLWLMLT